MSESSAPSRRSLLKVGLGGAALLAAGGLGLGLWPSAVQAPPPGLAVLDARTWTILSLVADALCPPGPGRPGALDLDVATLLDGTLRTLHPADAAELGQVLLLLENGLAGLLLDGRPRPFTHLERDERARALDAWRTSRLLVRRQGYKALRGLVMAAYWGHRETWAASGYPGPPDFGQAKAGPEDFEALAARGRRRLAGEAETAGTDDAADAPPETTP